jgi:hypothetical protein
MHGLWASLSRCNPLRAPGWFFSEKKNISVTPITPHLTNKREIGASPSTTQKSTNNKAQPRVESGSWLQVALYVD